MLAPQQGTQFASLSEPRDGNMNDAKRRSNQETVTLTDNTTGKSLELPILSGSTGPRAIDVSRLYAETGCFTYDPGFTSTVSCDSDITYIDGEEGVLMHRGYLIEDLAEHSDFMDVCYLLLYGELPNAKEKTTFEKSITYHTMLHEQRSEEHTSDLQSLMRISYAVFCSTKTTQSTPNQYD